MKIENLDKQLNIFLKWLDKLLVTDKKYSKFRGYSKDKIKEIVKERFKARYRKDTEITIKVLKIEPEIIPTSHKPDYLIGRIIYESKKYSGEKRKREMIFYLYSRNEIWAGVEIDSAYKYLLQSLFNDINEGVIEGRDWKKVKEYNKGVREEALKKLSVKLKGYSRTNIENLIREKLEERYGSYSNIIADLIEYREGVLGYGNKAWVTVTLDWAIKDKVHHREIDSPVMVLHMYSKDNIKVEWE